MKVEGHFPVYEAALQAITQNPEEVIRQRRTEQIMSLKLMFPEEIRARRRMRRTEYEKFETCMHDIESIKKSIELAVKTERDAGGKLLFPNKETRAVEVQTRLESDPTYNQRERMRRTMYSQVKYFDEEIDYLERMDQSLIEIMAMLTATIEYESKTGKGVENVSRSNRRASTRAKASASVASGSGESPLSIA